MRIERIDLDGFGRFHEASWQLDEGLTVLLGANEAGKTTLLNGLRALLFGFEPTRDGRTWYPALAGGRRGGRLTLRTEARERWVVERHGEKGGTGSLAVRAPSGNQGGQETLDRLLRGADRDLFNNIFAFGLGELQTFSSLSAEGVRGRIYGAGAGLGGTSAVDLERRMRQALDAVYLPRGQRPLNQLLARVEELRAEIADLARQPQEHADAHRERDQLRARAQELRAAIRETRERSSRHGRVSSAIPVVAELALLEEELAHGDAGLDAVAPDAVAILDRLLGEREASGVALASLDEQIATAELARDRLVVEEEVIGAADEIEAVLETLAGRVTADARRRDLEAGVARASAALADQLARAGDWDEERLLGLDDSIPEVEATRVHETAMLEARGALAEAENRHRAATDELAVREREEIVGVDTGAVEERAAAVRELEAMALKGEAHATRTVAGVPPTALAAAMAALAGAVLVGSLLGMAMIGAVAGVALAALVVVVGRRRGSPSSADMEGARERLLAVAGLPRTATDADLRSLSEELTLARARASLAGAARANLEARRADAERRAAEAELARTALATASEAWESWLAARGLPAGLAPEAARQLLAVAGAARRAARDRDQQRESLAELVAGDAAWSERADALLATLGEAAPAAPDRRVSLVRQLGERLARSRDARRRVTEIEAQLGGLTTRRGPAGRQLAQRDAAVTAHLERFGCPDPDRLRLRAAEAEARRELRARIRQLRERLTGIAGSGDAVTALVEEVRATDPDRLEAVRALAEEELARLEGEERDALSRIGALEARIRQLESAEELGTKRQELAAVEGRAAAMARDWAVRAVALELITQTRSRYERERQPDVVRAAETHFERITGGRYSRIVAPPGDASVRVETDGGESRTTDELSRGTAEQLYLALRFGLIEEFARHAEPLPVVMDDILVNFDAERAARAASAIRDLADRHQVVYFTCHAWTAELLDPTGDRTLALG